MPSAEELELWWERSLFAAIKRIYDLSVVGGPLHIVLDDGNLEDSHILFCLTCCDPEGWEHPAIPDSKTRYDPEIIAPSVIACIKLLSLPPEVREWLYGERWAPEIEPGDLTS